MLNQNYMETYMEEPQNKKYRYERKYIIEFNFLPKFISQLFLSRFIKSFPDRNVNNIYFDDYNFSSLNHNFDGLSKRNKYRVRWYSGLFEESNKTLEIKKKDEFLNSKKFFDLKSIKLKNFEDINNFYSKVLLKLKESKNYQLLNKISDKRPTLLNSYKRMYFENKSKKLRLTIDTDLFFYSPITKINFKEKFVIVEVKYDKEVNFFNELKKLSFTRYSKYVKGTSQTTFSSIIY